MLSEKYTKALKLFSNLVVVVGLGLSMRLMFVTQAATFTVTKTQDTADGACSANDCSLREAVIAANAAPGPDTIILPNGVYILTRNGVDDAAFTGDLDITDGLVILGAEKMNTIIDGNGSDRVFHITGGGFSVTISGATIRNGGGVNNGGGIYNNSGTLALTNSTISGNGTNVDGGGIYNTGTLYLTDSTVSNNSAGNDGGGIYNSNAAQVDRSTISGNTASTDGGGLFNAGTGTAILTNSTISGNNAVNFRGGGIRNGNNGIVTLTNGTVTKNDAGNNGGGIYNSGAATLTYSIIADNLGGGNCAGQAVISNGNNLENANTCGFDVGRGDLINTPSGLDPSLANNGGPTLTHALLNGSDAINHGNDVGCLRPDQRGYGRVGICDIGAFEFDGATPTPTNTPITPTPTNTRAFTPTPSNTPITPTLTNTPITPTPTNTPIMPTPTNTRTFTPTPTNTPFFPDTGNYRLFLPLVMKDYCPQTEGEPNDHYWQAQELISSVIYSGCHQGGGVDQDYFKISMLTKGSIVINLYNPDPGLQLHLYYQYPDESHRVGYDWSPEFVITCPSGEDDKCTGDAGAYYILVYTPAGYSTTKQYILQVTYP